MIPNKFLAYKANSDDKESQSPGNFYEVKEVNDPKLYVPSPDLINAVNVAILLGKPLLLTGDPGTGKTQLAYHLSDRFYGEPPLKFVAKTTSKARDLFYAYDAIRHFHDVTLRNAAAIGHRDGSSGSTVTSGLKNILKRPEKKGSLEDDVIQDEEYRKYIRFAGLGEAIVRPRKEPRRYVLLIDEIDKAPRDFPNNLLDEIDNMEFEIEETGQRISVDKKYRPIVIITSNSERLLPEPFLRRCIFHHIDFPNKKGLMEILQNRLENFTYNEQPQKLIINDKQLIILRDFFYDLRGDKYNLKKTPATAEFMSWIELLHQLDFNPEEPTQIEDMDEKHLDILKLSCTVLLKHKEDIEEINNRVFNKEDGSE